MGNSIALITLQEFAGVQIDQDSTAIVKWT